MASRAKTFLSVSEAGRAMGISVSTVWRRIRSGDLSSVRRGGRRLVSTAALAAAPSGGQDDTIAPFDHRHAIFRLVGAGRSGGQTPGARDKHGILASQP
jgi:excisionase family DNA binding protein